MTYYTTSNRIINNVWREILIVTSDQPQSFESSTITDRRTGPDEVTDFVYHTQGLHRSFAPDADGRYRYWFILTGKETRTTLTYKEQVETLAADQAESSVDLDYRLSCLELGL